MTKTTPTADDKCEIKRYIDQLRTFTELSFSFHNVNKKYIHFRKLIIVPTGMLRYCKGNAFSRVCMSVCSLGDPCTELQP